jgi:hypothetical protein
MKERINLKLKMPIWAVFWEKQGDHDLVKPETPEIAKQIGLPENFDHNRMGILYNTPQGHAVISAGVYIIETGGNVFPVDEKYFNDMYEIIKEEPKQKTKIKNVKEKENNKSK